MKISLDTKEDSHEEIKKVIKMLQNLVGDSQEIFTNEPQSSQETAVPFTNIFGDTSNTAQQTSNTEQITKETEEAQAKATEQSTEDLFAELFSDKELKKMEATPAKEEDEKEEELPKTKSKKYGIEFY